MKPSEMTDIQMAGFLLDFGYGPYTDEQKAKIKEKLTALYATYGEEYEEEGA